MNGICLIAGIAAVALGPSLTLQWEHSIAKQRWEEDYRVEAGRLRLVEARIRGTAAGMEVPEGARFSDGAWHYRPDLPLLPELQLRHSPYVAPYVICVAGNCQSMDAWLPALPDETVVRLAPCDVKPGIDAAPR